jgi:hypothetical protein
MPGHRASRDALEEFLHLLWRHKSNPLPELEILHFQPFTAKLLILLRFSVDNGYGMTPNYRCG